MYDSKQLINLARLSFAIAIIETMLYLLNYDQFPTAALIKFSYEYFKIKLAFAFFAFYRFQCPHYGRSFKLYTRK